MMYTIPMNDQMNDQICVVLNLGHTEKLESLSTSGLLLGQRNKIGEIEITPDALAAFVARKPNNPKEHKQHQWLVEQVLFLLFQQVVALPANLYALTKLSQQDTVAHARLESGSLNLQTELNTALSKLSAVLGAAQFTTLYVQELLLRNMAYDDYVNELRRGVSQVFEILNKETIAAVTWLKNSTEINIDQETNELLALFFTTAAELNTEMTTLQAYVLKTLADADQ